MLKNTDTQYGSLAIFFHWIIALFIITLLSVGLYMTGIDDNATKGFVYNMHKSFGLTVLVLVCLRFLWMLVNPKPKLPEGTPAWEVILEKAGHWSLYFLMFIMPLSGWLMSTAADRNPNVFWLFELAMPGVPHNKVLAEAANLTHKIMAWTLIVVVSLHALAALKHHFVNKDDVLKRMMKTV